MSPISPNQRYLKICAGLMLLILESIFIIQCGKGLYPLGEMVHLPSSISVNRIYANNNALDSAAWNYYVDGLDTTTDCDPATAISCLHGGEARKVALPGVSTCSGINASDALGVFSWRCEIQQGTATFVTAGFKTGKGLSHLLNASSFKNNSVTVSYKYQSVTSPLESWWTNTVEPLPSAATIQTLSDAGKIYTLSSSNTANGYYIAADRIAVVILPGATLTYGDNAALNCDLLDGDTVGADRICLITVGRGGDSSRNFIWIEGTLDADATTNDAEHGIFFQTVKFSKLRGISIFNAANDALFIEDSDNNIVSSYKASSPVSRGFHLLNSDKNMLHEITIMNCGFFAFTLTTSDQNTLSRITAANTDDHGITLSDSVDNIFSQITLFNTGGTGIVANNIDNSVFHSTITSKQQDHGIYLRTGSQSNTLHAFISYLNGNHGIFISDADNNSFLETISTNNTDNGIITDGTADNNSFIGDLLLGNNSNGNCDISGPGSSISGVDADCTKPAPNPLLEIVNTATSADSFRGLAVDGDTANTHDADIDVGNGVVAFALPITDWINFENLFRGWGPAAGNDQCTALNEPCGLWDWSLALGDTGDPRNGGQPVLFNTFSCPGGSDVITHTWSDASTTSFLTSAAEVLEDRIGDEDGLCESNETCVFTPNKGPYFGHGNLLSAASVSGCPNIGTGGTVENIMLLQYQTNGY